MFVQISRRYCPWPATRIALSLIALCVLAAPAYAASGFDQHALAPVPPMGWNDWAHYQCDFNDRTILANAQALAKTGLRERGYNTVTIDDCWMLKNRDRQGNLQVDPKRFPQGMKPVAEAVHNLGLKFGIYEDAGYETCGGFAGSGEPKGGGVYHFLQDARLFASWGVDYLKLDGCNVYVPKGDSMDAAYRKAYAAESAALHVVGRPVVFSESAPAYFQGSPAWYDVLSWVGGYGQLWREGEDIETFDPKKPDRARYRYVLWNYAYNLPLGRFQKPGNWNDPDFIIGGDSGMSPAETRTQMTAWSMMSAPLILSSDLAKLTPEAISILGNRAVIAIDQDGLGRMATLVRRTATTDLLLKPLSGGEYAIALLNRGEAPIRADLRPADLGFAENGQCRLSARNLWSGEQPSHASSLTGKIARHDAAIWRVRADSACGAPPRAGAVVMIAVGEHRDIGSYSRCLAAPGSVGDCQGASAERWTFTAKGALESAGRCLTASGDKAATQPCSSSKDQTWKYTLAGNLLGADGKCLTGGSSKSQSLSMQACGHNRPDQIWSLPN